MADLLQKEDITEFERWETPAVAGDAPAGQLRTVAQLEALEQQAYDEGFARGREEGLKAGADEAVRRVERLDGLLLQLNAPLDELDAIVERELCELTFAIARQVVRREIKTGPGEVIGAVREALAVLPVSFRNVRLHLHPDDAALVREALTPADGEAGWRIVEDPMLTRGGCRVVSDTSRIYARIEKRLGAAINAVLGGERTADGDEVDGGDA
jgi:flagellar assembly protein FliH